MARPQGVEGLGMAGPGETVRSPWPPLSIRCDLIGLQAIRLAGDHPRNGHSTFPCLILEFTSVQLVPLELRHILDDFVLLQLRLLAEVRRQLQRNQIPPATGKGKQK